MINGPSQKLRWVQGIRRIIIYSDPWVNRAHRLTCANAYKMIGEHRMRLRTAARHVTLDAASRGVPAALQAGARMTAQTLPICIKTDAVFEEAISFLNQWSLPLFTRAENPEDFATNGVLFVFCPNG